MIIKKVLLFGIKRLGLATLLFLIPGKEVRAKEFDVMKFGAQNDTTVLSTEAFNNAIGACHENGGGRVVVPAGMYKTGTITMLDHVELYLEHGAYLFAGTSREVFPRQQQNTYRSLGDSVGRYALIYAEGAENIAITGHGTIHGQGNKWLYGVEDPRRPLNIVFISCRKVRIEGITMMHSRSWNQHYLNCEDVVIDGIHVYNHGRHNNDALDIDGCRRVIVSNCIMDSGDDGITLKSMGKAACEDIAITNCVVSSHCYAIKAGTESTGGFQNITISNSVVKPSINEGMLYGRRTGYGAIALEIVDGGTMEGVTIDNVIIDGTACPLYIRLANRARKHIPEVTEPPMGTMRNISISNVVAYNTGNYSSSITSIPGSYIENVMLSNIQLYNRGDIKPGDYIASEDEVEEKEKAYPSATNWQNLPSSALFIRHVKNIMIRGLMTGSELTDPRVPVIARDVKGLSIIHTQVTGKNTANTFFQGKDVSVYDVEKPLGWQKETIVIKQ
ncbi:MAG: glycosyl hydrolase family 28 protein [Bacteroidota bacterium]